ncbi:hypothetical protein ANSO36C_42460 [Nostoc cf. commune SO-36]|uniref:Uncharacterized protein n=1 Tax=Nostoc cf. commune SO-36 TaxID=449208 RepID=A0ABN6Q6I5_NOSCO|nr:hypothetical protein ANSO36C_42460 [Nostoc cf. commune SO-36]
MIATTNRESKISFILCAETPAGRIEKEAELPIITDKDFREAEPGGLIQE